ncbi:MAG TPA: OmpH family outer membrane protein [Rhodospirillales bacterium]|nr:OmpH family outer membrane protein [Rhodospirillales bacterium]
MGYFISPKFYTIAWICCITFLFGSVAIGETQSRTIKLGVVDLNEITRKSLMSKDIARQIDSKRRAFRDEIKNEEEKLRSDNDELQKQRVLLSPEALQEKYRALQQRQTALQRKVQQRNQEFIRLRSFATREFEKERVKAVMDVTKKHKFTLVIRRREVVVRADFLDITGLVLETLNKRKAKFKIPDDLAKSGK